MKPYYEHGGISIYHADFRDCQSVLRACDLVLTDPPYGETSLAWDRQISGWMSFVSAISKSLWCFGSLQMFMDLATGWAVIYGRLSGGRVNREQTPQEAETSVASKQGSTTVVLDKSRTLALLQVLGIDGDAADWCAELDVRVQKPEAA